MNPEDFDKHYDHSEVEQKCRKLWEDSGIHRFDANSDRPVFSVDTPPPYVSAHHLHVGHAMSYSQAEFVVRYQRMRGKNIFYPMGFDDNGLPTERFVEQKHKINKRKTTRSEFRELCLKETQAGAKVYETLWKQLGLSVDWSLRYSTIDSRCQKVAQESFIDLYEKGFIYRSNEPVLWDTHFESALAQTDLETISRKGTLYEILCGTLAGQEIVIATTRPELLPACVALYCHPEDTRYSNLIGMHLKVPLFGHEVPIKASPEVDPTFGTGLMMVCTFGDAEDVQKWKEDSLETRTILLPNGKFNDEAGPYQGMTIEEARKAIVQDLRNCSLILAEHTMNQNVSVSERSGRPVEFMLTPQWFVRILDFKEKLLERSQQLKWHPEFMKVRLDSWIEGLKYDWNISRQRFYGVPIPVWYEADGTVVLPDRESLPVDPLEDRCPNGHAHPDSLIGDADVMDTWMISSLTPLINAHWSGKGDSLESSTIYPMTVRVQGFEIIRTWLFYTLYKSEAHTSSLPWKEVMISGWGLNEQGKKISKRDLEQHTDASGYNRYTPESVINKHGADALRYWAAGSQLGQDLKYNEKDVRAGRKLVLKLWNAARFSSLHFNMDFIHSSQQLSWEKRSLEDRWILTEFWKTCELCGSNFENYDYARARESLSKFFWQAFCDTYLELIKDRFNRTSLYSDELRNSASLTLWETLRGLIGLFAPFIPFVTEEIYQRIYRKYESTDSIHISSWPEAPKDIQLNVAGIPLLLDILDTVRNLRTQKGISQASPIKCLRYNSSHCSDVEQELIETLRGSLFSLSRCEELTNGQAQSPCGSHSLLIDIDP